MIKCISYWSIKGGLDGAAPIDAAMDQAKSAGFQGLELAIAQSGVLTPATDQKTCESYRQMGQDRRLAVQTLASGMAWGCSATHPDKSVREQSIKLHQDALQRAKWLGCEAMLYVPGAISIPWDPSYPRVPYKQAFDWAREGIKRVGEVAEKVGVDLCVENVWNGLFYSPLEFAAVIDEIKSPHVGVYFDVGNFLGLHQWPPHWIEHLGSRIKRIHIKDFKLSIGNITGFCDLLAGDIPWKQSMAALRKIDYDKTIVAEMMPPDDTLLQRTSKAMDQILQM